MDDEINVICRTCTLSHVSCTIPNMHVHVSAHAHILSVHVHSYTYYAPYSLTLSQEAKSGLERCMSQDDPEARRQAAMHDPEVQKILHDPAMQLILQQMQSNPAALRE